MTTSNQSSEASDNHGTAKPKEWRTPTLRILEVQSNTQGGGGSASTEGFYSAS